jgi:hypothetical protein
VKNSELTAFVSPRNQFGISKLSYVKPAPRDFSGIQARKNAKSNVFQDKSLIKTRNSAKSWTMALKLDCVTLIDQSGTRKLFLVSCVLHKLLYGMNRPNYAMSALKANRFMTLGLSHAKPENALQIKDGAKSRKTVCC